MPDSTGPAAASPPQASPAEVFDRLVHGVCERRWDELPSLYAERTHVVHPHDPLRPPPLLSRRELAEHFRGSGDALGELRFSPAAMTVHETADPEVIVAEFEYRGVIPGTDEPFAIPNIFVLRVRDGQIVESRDYGDHAEIARVLGRGGPASPPAGGDWRERAQRHYEDAVFDDDAAALDTADQELDAIEAGLALARGRITHARFLLADESADPALANFERAAELYQELGDARGEAEALFWKATFYQVVRDDSGTALPLLEQSGELAAAAGDTLTLSYVARHIGFADQGAGRLDSARLRFTESLQLRRDLGFQRGVAAALLALAEFTSQHGNPAEADALLAEALDTAQASGARGIQRRIEQSRAARSAAKSGPSRSSPAA